MRRPKPTASRLSAFLGGFILFIVCSAFTVGQPSYTFSIATGTYADLAGAIPLSSDVGVPLSDTNFLVDLGGEVVRLYGKDYRVDAGNPLIVDGSGFIRFDGSSDAVVIDGFLANLDRFDGESRISYMIDQNEGERILKVEWRKVAPIDSPEVAGDYLSFQVWVHQSSGVVELHYGPRMLFADSGVAVGGGPFVGIFRFSQVPVFRIFEKNWLIGNPFDPTYDTTRTGFSILEGCPPEGTIFRFTPRVATGVDEGEGMDDKDGMGEVKLVPNPTDGRVSVRTVRPLAGNARLAVTDALGRVVIETVMQAGARAHELDLPEPGVYFCEIEGETGSRSFKVIRR